MPKLSVIIASDSHWEHIDDTLTSLENQTVTDFEVIFIRPQIDKALADSITEFCMKAEGRFDITEEDALVPNLLNRGLLAASGEYIMFLTPGDFLPEGSIEGFIETAAEKADIITGRFWLNSENSEPGYDKNADSIVLKPQIDRFSKSFPHFFEISCRIFKLKALEKHNITFPETKHMYDYLFFMRAVLSGMKISGCPYGILYRKVRSLTEGDIREGVPTKEGLEQTLEALRQIEELAQLKIIEETGIFEGDEYYIQELLESQINLLLNRFYRRFWYLDAKTLKLLKAAVYERVEKLTESRFARLKDEHKDLSFPFIYGSIDEAVAEPTFSFIIDVTKGDITQLVESFYLQSFPFFELFVKESVVDSGRAGNKWLDAPNFVITPDKNFFGLARSHARSRTIIVTKDDEPLDAEVLKATHNAAVPNFLKAAVFTKNKKEKSIRTYLKNKGASLSDD